MVPRTGCWPWREGKEDLQQFPVTPWGRAQPEQSPTGEMPLLMSGTEVPQPQRPVAVPHTNLPCSAGAQSGSN